MECRTPKSGIAIVGRKDGQTDVVMGDERGLQIQSEVGSNWEMEMEEGNQTEEGGCPLPARQQGATVSSPALHSADGRTSRCLHGTSCAGPGLF